MAVETSRGETLAQVNHEPLPVLMQAQVAFYASLTQLADQVKAGTHPIIKLPPEARSMLPWHLGRDLEKVVHSAAAPDVRTTSQKYSGLATRFASSIIDPILLTKSDLVIRAELGLKRKRLEHELLQQFDRKHGHGRDRDNLLEVAQNYDPQVILAQAFKVVAPSSGIQLPGNQNRPASGSFDENSYYSSKANSWSSEDGECRPGTEAVRSPNGTRHTPPGDTNAYITGEVDDTQDTLELWGPRAQAYTSPRILHAASKLHPSERRIQEFEISREDNRDESYSPPAADAFNTFPAQTLLAESDATRNQQIGHINQQVHRRKSQYDESTQQPPVPASPSSPPFPVVTNKISVPLAPRPARVSPLANAHVQEIPDQVDISRPSNHIQLEAPSPRPLYSRNREQRSTRRASERGPNLDAQPSQRQPPYNSRKRRRDNEPVEHLRRTSGKRVARSPARSPEPYIKQEPVSPPPASNEPPRRLILRDDGQADIEIVPSASRQDDTYLRDVAYSQPVQLYSSRPSFPPLHGVSSDRYSLRDTYDYIQPEGHYEVSHTVQPEPINLFSPAPFQSQNVGDKRTAALQSNVRPRSALSRQQPSSPTMMQAVRYSSRQPIHYAAIDATPIRTSDRSHSARPQSSLPQAARYSATETQPYHSYHMQQPIQYQNAREPSRVIMDRTVMPPPPSARRIVIDQYGNEYIAVPTATRSNYSAAPEYSYTPDRAVSYQPMQVPRERYVSVASSYDLAPIDRVQLR